MKLDHGTQGRPVLARRLLGPSASLLAACVIATCDARLPRADHQAAGDWRSEWAVEEDFALEVDSEGYRYPTAIAFVAEPGDAPDDPLYFVTELEGAIKLVTNDRTVHVFARTSLAIPPAVALPESDGESGQAGLCLDQERGFVFVTFSYNDADGTLRNGIVRFETEPRTFALEPNGQLEILAPMLADETSVAHQIGGCEVHGDHLYVGVGDGYTPRKARSIDSSLGKLLRMNLDGTPVATNPFFQDDGEHRTEDYVWAYGFRNPFGIEIVDGRVFVADNGPSFDRFVEVLEGHDYLWNGSNWSIGARADLTFSPSVGPVQMDYVTSDDRLLSGLHESFLVASSGPPASSGPGKKGDKSVIQIPYDLERGRVADVPQLLVSYRGDLHQSIVGVASGPGGVYFVPLFPDGSNQTRIYRTFYDPEHAHPFRAGLASARHLIHHYGCLGCHMIGDEGTALGPALDAFGLVERIEERLDALSEASSVPPEVSRVLDLEGEARVRAWISAQIQEPGFDTGSSAMPMLGVEPAEADVIADYLVTGRPFAARLRSIIGPIRLRELFGAMVIAFVLGACLTPALVRLIRAWRSRRQRAAVPS